jgi:dephospho-CoA kinase
VNTKPFTGLPVIGLVGGVGSGKSSVARGLAARQNYVVIDADALGHQVLQEADVKKQIKNRFGEVVFNERGEIDRSQLARRVFGADEESELARNDLNRIVHPRIGDKIHQEIQRARESARREPGTVPGVLLDAAILLETGWAEMCDAVVFVEASEGVRQNRVRETRGWDRAEWKKREDSQLNLKAKQNAADATIHNSQDLELAVAELEQFLASRFFAAKLS